MNTPELIAKLQIQTFSLHVQHVPELKELIEQTMDRLEEYERQLAACNEAYAALRESHAKGGRARSEKKSEASKLNGMKGGRPKKNV